MLLVFKGKIEQRKISSGKESQFKNPSWALEQPGAFWVDNYSPNVDAVAFIHQLLLTSLYQQNDSAPQAVASRYLPLGFLQSQQLLRRMRASRIPSCSGVALYGRDSRAVTQAGLPSS